MMARLLKARALALLFVAFACQREKPMSGPSPFLALEPAHPSGKGTPTDPIVIFLNDGDYPELKSIWSYSGNTANAPSNAIDQYYGYSQNASGGEYVFRLTVNNRFDLTASLTISSGDIDIYLLSDGFQILNREVYANDGTSSAVIQRDDQSFTEYNLQAGTYYLIADTFNNNEGNFQLNLTVKHDITGSGSLTSPIIIPEDRAGHAGGYFLWSTTSNRGGYFDRYLPYSQKEYGKEKIFQLTTTQRYYITISIDNDSNDPDLHLLQSLNKNSNNEATDVIARDDDRIGPMIIDPGTYYIVVDTYGTDYSATSSYRLKVKLHW